MSYFAVLLYTPFLPYLVSDLLTFTINGFNHFISIVHFRHSSNFATTKQSLEY